MPWTAPTQKLTATAILRGLMTLPWGAPLFGAVQPRRP
jgi:hypothetical protein